MTREDLIQALVANNDGKKDDLIIAIEKAMNYGYNVAIDRACEWLKEQSCCGYIEDVEIYKFIESFKQAMVED